MGERRVAFAVVLCEDREHELLAVRYLTRRFKLKWPRQFRINKAPPSGGSAEQYVRENYAREVAAYRRRAQAHSLCLLVIIDADKSAIDSRIKELEARFPRNESDRVAIFVPRRNVETWAFAFSGNDANESDNYGEQPPERIHRAAEQLAEGRDASLPSARAALLEAERLDRFGDP